MPAPVPEVTALRKVIERAATGDPVTNRRLRDLRKDVAAVLAECDRYLDSGELAREAGAVGRRIDLNAARRRAEIREDLLAEERFNADELDALGFFSHTRLDEMEADGTLEATLAELPGLPVGVGA